MKQTQAASVMPVTVPIDALRVNPWNPNVQSEFMFQKERQSIREFGFIDPITVRRGRSADDVFPQMEIIDGEHRWRAAKLEGLTEVSVVDLGFLSDARAKVLTDVLNSLGGKNDEPRWAEMIASIQADDEALLALLPYDDDELQKRLMLAPVDWAALGVTQEQRDLGGESSNGSASGNYEAVTFQLSADDARFCKGVLKSLVDAGLADSDAAALRLALEEAERALLS